MKEEDSQVFSHAGHSQINFRQVYIWRLRNLKFISLKITLTHTSVPPESCCVPVGVCVCLHWDILGYTGFTCVSPWTSVQGKRK